MPDVSGERSIVVTPLDPAHAATVRAMCARYPDGDELRESNAPGGSDDVAAGVKIGSLFTGSGMLDLAVQRIFGGEIVWHAERDRHAAKVLAARFPGVPNLGDVADVDWAAVEPVDILTGGFPCQDVSTAGRRASLRPREIHSNGLLQG